nr:uncharacterized protein CI109_000741 [Kwoniella shandongensis]KAA5530563.1 hypothetical protein CI109_000741 [Kwoniella shandongensis]
MVKRELDNSPTSDVDSGSEYTTPTPNKQATPPSTPKNKTKVKTDATSPSNKTPVKSSPKKPRTSPIKSELSGGGGGATSGRGKIAEMIINAGIAALDRKQAEAATGISTKQQVQMLRTDGKGSLYKALMETAKSL